MKIAHFHVSHYSKDVRLPVQLQRAMAAEAEAAREARAKVIAAEGEQRASRALKEAADVINESPAALQVRSGHLWWKNKNIRSVDLVLSYALLKGFFGRFHSNNRDAIRSNMSKYVLPSLILFTLNNMFRLIEYH